MKGIHLSGIAWVERLLEKLQSAKRN